MRALDRSGPQRATARDASVEPASADCDSCRPVPVPGLAHRPADADQARAAERPRSGAPAASIVSTLRRYREVRMPNDEMHTFAVQDRASRNDMGFQSTANIGWIVLGTETTFGEPHIESSGHGTAHSEERLITWALAQGADLSLAPTAPGETLRVKGLYTERAPCRVADNLGGDPARYARVATDRCCQAYLQRVLHAEVDVIHSVDNAPAPHELLRNGEWIKHHKKKQLQRVVQAYNAKRKLVGHGRELLDLLEAHRATIVALQPASLSRFFVDNHRVAVTEAANTAIAAIQAWQPPVTDDATPGPAPGPDGPPGPDDPPPGSKRGASGDPAPTGKRQHLVAVP